MLFVFRVHWSGSSIRWMDIELCCAYWNIHKVIGNSIQFCLLGVHDSFQIHICFHQCQTLTKIANPDYDATACHSFGRYHGGSVWREMVSSLHSLCLVWNFIFSNVWAFLCPTFVIRRGSHLLRRIKLLNVWTTGRGNDIHGCWVPDELVHSDDAVLLCAFMWAFATLDVSKNHKYPNSQ